MIRAISIPGPRAWWKPLARAPGQSAQRPSRLSGKRAIDSSMLKTYVCKRVLYFDDPEMTLWNLLRSSFSDDQAAGSFLSGNTSFAAERAICPELQSTGRVDACTPTCCMGPRRAQCTLHTPFFSLFVRASLTVSSHVCWVSTLIMSQQH